MEPKAASTYDEMPYEDVAIYHTHPSNLAVVATLCGLSAPPIDDCRVLELGCGAGFNLLAMSQSLPGARLVGIDLSSRHIEAGREMAGAIGAANVDLRVGDIGKLDASLGEFDYVIAHGVLSWVPPAVREEIFGICRRHLQPAGIAYLSYNTYPGWHQRGILRDVLRFHASIEGSPLQRVQHARAMLERMVGEIPDRDSDYLRFLRREVEGLRDDSDAYVFHEFLETHNHPLRFEEFAALAASSGLRYFAEARYGTAAFVQDGEVRQALDAVSGDLLRQEQYLDLLRNRFFRQSLICHAAQQPTWKLSPRSRGSLVVISKVEQVSPDAQGRRTFRLHGEYEVRPADPVIVAILDVLSEMWPVSMTTRQLIGMAAERLDAGVLPPGVPAEPAIASTIAAGYGWGYWHLYAHNPPAVVDPGEYPRAGALARVCAARSASVTNLLHRPVELSTDEQAVLARLDGRISAEALSASLAMAPDAIERTIRRLAESYLLEG